MIPPRAFLRWPALLASLALSIASAQEQTARLVKDANREPGDFKTYIRWVIPIGKGAVFPMDTLSHGSELWTSDGTPRGTRLLKDATPGPGGSFPEDPVAFGGAGGVRPQVAFRIQHDATGNEAWVTDGTEAGTKQIFKSPSPGADGEIRVQAGTPGGVFFEDINWNQKEPYELFFSDGTAAGTWSLNPMDGDGRARFTDPYGYVANGPWCYFIANENEIWRSDGTAAGTTKELTVTQGWPNSLAFAGERMFVDVGFVSEFSELWSCPLGSSELTPVDLPDDTGDAWIEEMIALDDELCFIRTDEFYERALWVTDGTAPGTHRVPLLQTGEAVESRALVPIRAWQGALYLPASTSDGKNELWRTDGTPQGTRRLATFSPPKANLSVYEMPATSDSLYFHVSDDKWRQHLWRTKGDAASTRPVKGAPANFPTSEWPQLAAMESDLFFVAEQFSTKESLWRLRGKTSSAVRLTRPEKSTGSGTAPSPVNAQPYEMLEGNLLSFVNTGGACELWRMNPDGSQAQAVWKAPDALLDYGAAAFHATTARGAIFSYYDGADVRQVWVTDGTRRGTRLLSDHGAATGDAYPYDFVKLGDVWFYSVVNTFDPAKASLWRTDGTPEGTTKVIASNGAAPGPDAGEMVVFQNRLYFLATGVDGKTALWLSDGTAAGTIRLKDEWYGEAGERAAQLSVAGGELVFAVQLAHADELWHSDGTTAGTAEVSYPAGSFFPGSISPAVDLGGVAIFQGTRWAVPQTHLWRHDATGTSPLRSDILKQHSYPWQAGSRQQAVAGGYLFYLGVQDHDGELWATDGTDSGTHRVKDIYPGPLPSYPAEMLAVGDVVYFTATDEDHGTELWRSDGTEAGTVLIADIEPGQGGSLPRGLKVMNGKLYFSAERRDVGRELFVIDLPE